MDAIRLRGGGTAHLLLVVIIVVPILWSVVETGLAVRGNRDPVWRERVLRYFSAADIERGREYRSSFIPGGVVRDLVFWGILALCVLAGGGRWLAERAAGLAGARPVLSVLLVTLALGIAIRLASFPVDAYHGYGLEGRFGFRRLDFLPWLLRLLKSHAISIAIEAVLVTGLFALIRHFPGRWPLYATAAGAIATFLFAIAWHAVVLPLFYHVSPLAAGPLRDGVSALAARAGVPVAEIRVIDQSRVSSHTNAFFTGIGGRREIYLYDTLSEQHDVPEVLAVVAHEIGHWQHQHVLKGWALGVLGMAAGLVLLARLLRSPAFLDAAGLNGPADPALVPVLFALFAAASIAVAPLGNGLSRHFERQCDRASLALTGDPQTFIAMKVEMARRNRSQLLPHPLLVFWNATHPPTVERIEMAAAALAAGPADRQSAP